MYLPKFCIMSYIFIWQVFQTGNCPVELHFYFGIHFILSSNLVCTSVNNVGYNFYPVDDGSGTIGCCCWHSSDPNEERRELYDLGQLVTVQGKISVFREQRQLTVDQICIQAHQLIRMFLLNVY